ncbi:hypothetical protein CF121_18840 [Aeromonas media]|uniref:hypothetical protein n=1 Tax=Aeromonas media TaxID=651 RepID=UPI0011167465|nr:hypothetical protein [Aeromonas media]TNI55959.1 hypothetical protein CF121_18840 [Aeromonas media]
MSTLLLMLNPPALPDEGGGFVCLEPQSHAADAHHLAGHPGLRLLGRGDRMSLGMTLGLRPAS